MLIEDDWKLSWITSLSPRIIPSKKANAARDIRFSCVKSASIKTVTLLCVSSSLLQFLRSVHFSTLFQYLRQRMEEKENKQEQTL